MLIDTHCHLTDASFTGVVKEVIKEARMAGVEKILVPTTGILDAKRALEIAAMNEDVFVMAGIHPEVLEDDTRPENRVEWLAVGGNWIEKLDEVVSNSNVIGIGEIGLDFHRDKEKSSKNLQMEIFGQQLDLAIKRKLPVVIHMRDAEEEMRSVLMKRSILPRGQFHCWSGSSDFMKYVLERGFYVSFCGNITFKSAENLRVLVKEVPLERLLLETDAPLMAPEPVRGSKNTPANVKITAGYIARLLQIDSEKLINQTGSNAQCLFFDIC